MRGQYRLKKMLNRAGRALGGPPFPLAINKVNLNGIPLTLMTTQEDVVLGSMLRGEMPMCPHYLAELEVLQSLLKPNCQILDAGANIGSYAVAMAVSEPTSTIYAFEPDPLNFSILNMNVRLNNVTNVHTFNCALGKEDGFLTFYCSPVNFGDHRSSKPGEMENLRESDFQALPKRIPVNNPVNALKAAFQDDCPTQLDILKIDTQGADLEILDACLPLIGEGTELTIEYSPYHYANHGTTRDDVERVIGLRPRIEKIAPVSSGSQRLDEIDLQDILEYFDAQSVKYIEHCDLLLTF